MLSDDVTNKVNTFIQISLVVIIGLNCTIKLYS
jgi:hypothetical protein